MLPAIRETKRAKLSTGGLFGTLSMRNISKNGHGNQILQLAEMKNGECKKYKISLLKKLRSKRKNGKPIKVGKYTHDLSCTLKEMEGDLCDKVFLDAYHRPKHKCDTPILSKENYPNLNSLAAEQLWRVMEGLQATISHLSRSKYRMFLKHYCQWRNEFIQSQFANRSDVNPSLSQRRARRRGLG